MEIKRQLDVLDRQLAENDYIAGDEYTIADMAIWPWYGALVTNKVYEAAEFIEAHTYKNVLRWTEQIRQRPAVERGRKVNRAWGNRPVNCGSGMTPATSSCAPWTNCKVSNSKLQGLLKRRVLRLVFSGNPLARWP